MNNELVLEAAGELFRADLNPAVVYLRSLTARSRPTMEWSLRSAVEIFSGGKKNDPFAFAWQELRVQHIHALRAELIDRKVALGTANKMLVAVRRVIESCFELNLLPHEDYLRLRRVKAIKGSRVVVGRMLEPHEIEALYRATDPATVIGVRDRAALTCLQFGALRRLELSLLTMDQWDRKNGEFRVLGKGNKERVVPLTETAQQYLEEWLKLRGTHDGPIIHPLTRVGRVLPRGMSPSTTYALLKRLATQAGVEEVSPHDFRRTFISNLLDLGADIAVVADLVGHAQVETTRKYDRRGDEAKRKAVNLLERKLK